MPFDGVIQLLQQQVVPQPVPPAPSRWGKPSGGPPVPRDLVPVPDALVIWRIWYELRRNPVSWAQGAYVTPDQACLVGWMQKYTEPTNKPKVWSAQSTRVLRLIHDALPKSAQRRNSPQDAIAAYNDTHGLTSVLRVLERAYGAAEGR